MTHLILFLSLASPSASADPIVPDPEWVLDNHFVAGGLYDDGSIAYEVDRADHPRAVGPGDLNGDGYADLIVTAPDWDAATGALELYLGGEEGFSTLPDLFFVGRDFGLVEGQGIGWTSAAAGDVNDDGYADVIIGPRPYSDTPMLEVLLFLGSPTGLDETPIGLTSPDGTIRLGETFSGGGDINGDGYADVVVETYRQFETPEIYVYLGGPTGPASTPDFVLETLPGDPQVGGGISSAGDINGDGYADIVQHVTDDWDYTGPLHIFLGSATGPSSAYLSIPDVRVGNLAAAGDVTGDGIDDVTFTWMLDSARGHSDVVVYPGSPSGLDTAGAFTDTCETCSRIAGVGDIDDDGINDVIVWRGDWLSLRYGGGSPLESEDPIALGSYHSTRSAIGVGDVNGDGFEDIAYSDNEYLAVHLGCPGGDADGDGSYVCGRQPDCDDADPAFHPGADDTDGDGIDHDCDGTDAAAAAAEDPEEPEDTGSPDESGSESEGSEDDETGTASAAPAADGTGGAKGGGCSTTGGTPAWMLAGLTLVGLMIRRRR